MKRNVARLKDEIFDLLVLGGGITGAGVALDAALRGLRVALIDKGDFASGTSSVSSKLVHGGLRYLEHGNFHLVYEALHERRLLLENAPHLVRPLRFILPFYRGMRVPSWKWRAGLTLYDLLAGTSNLRRSRPLAAQVLQKQFPGLKPIALSGGAEYFDAQMDDARLCLAVIRSAVREGACAANYVEALGLEFGAASITAVGALDRVGGTELAIRARQVLNATGPWLDQVCRLAGENVEPHLRPTKGVHLLAPGRDLSAAFLLLHPRDGRVFFVIPWMGKTLVGTTDTLCDEGPDALSVTAEEIDYLLEGHNEFFNPPLEAGGILNTFAGLRPLIRSRGEPSALSREFRLFSQPPGMLSVAGGKYTTYRRMAEIIVDEIARRLGRRRPTKTRSYRLDGCPDMPWEQFESAEIARLTGKFCLAEETARSLVNRYGSNADLVSGYLVKDPKLAGQWIADEPETRAEFGYQRDHEMAIQPADFLLRRTRLGLFHPELLKKRFPL